MGSRSRRRRGQVLRLAALGAIAAGGVAVASSRRPRWADGEDPFFAEALKLAAELRPDIGLLDLGLPGIDGLEVCRRLRQSAAGKDMLLVALTGWGQECDKHNSHAAGFDGHLTKPVDPERIGFELERMRRAKAGG